MLNPDFFGMPAMCQALYFEDVYTYKQFISKGKLNKPALRKSWGIL